MRRTGVWVSVVQELHHPPNFFWILAATPGCQHTMGLLPSMVVFIFIWFWVLVGLEANRGSPRSFRSTWHRCWMGIYPTPIFPFSSLTVSWYSCSWWSGRAWGRCRMITLLSWRCHWGWRMRTWKKNFDDKPGTTIGTKLSVLHCIGIPFLSEKWFSTVDPLIRISVFIAKLSER